MAKKVELKERGTNNTMYPITSIKNVIDFPLTDKPNMVLKSTGNSEMEWSDLSKVILDTYSYGVSWELNVADPALTRVGNLEYHKTLPIQSGMRGCIYNPKEKKVVYWLDPDNWNERVESIELTGAGQQLSDTENILIPSSYYDSIGKYSKINIDDTIYGTIIDKSTVGSDDLFSVTVQWDDYDEANHYLWDKINDNHIYYLGSNLSGYDGEVMVYVPEFWIKSWSEGTNREVRVSPTYVDNTWEHQPAVFIGAYKDTILNEVPENMGYLSTLEVGTAVCVANSEPYCRGGNNSAINDTLEDIFRRNLGKPRTSISRANMRIAERKAGKEILSYRQYKNILYWLWVIEYATFNSQAPFLYLNSEGYHQGGMGTGITTMSNWNEYNNYNPVCINGYTNAVGNYTASVDLVIPAFTYTMEGVETTRAARTLKAIKWRGIENPFGDTWTNVDGIIIDADADNHNPANYNYVYTTDNPSKYGDTIDDIKNMILSGLEIHEEGYIKRWDLGNTAEMIPILNGGTTTQYKCDYHYVGNKNTTLRTLLLGGNATNGGTAGLGCFGSSYGVAYSHSYIGFRASCIA